MLTFLKEITQKSDMMIGTWEYGNYPICSTKCCPIAIMGMEHEPVTYLKIVPRLRTHKAFHNGK
jgi:hypothetical protein